jgi:hypothetical protein
MSFVCGDLMDEQFLGVLCCVLTAADGALPHIREIGILI